MREQRQKKPWPTKKVMEQIYDKRLWGSNGSPFYSGQGSHLSEIIDSYIDSVSSFLNAHDAALIVCDLGCGDFNVGRQLVPYTRKYIAMDIVEGLIAFNKEHFSAPNLEFRCLDIVADDLPHGDCAILRQVLQHLSNAEIQVIVNKLRIFKYALLTEHLPKGEFVPNKDIVSGQGTRLKKGSGVDLLAAPFRLKVKEKKILNSYDDLVFGGRIVTVLYRLDD